MMDADVGCVQRTGTCNGALHAPYTHHPKDDGALDDHFTNRWAAAIGLDKTGRLRQAGKSSRSRGKDVHHAKPICPSDCLECRSATSLAGPDPGPFHSVGFGLPLSVG